MLNKKQVVSILIITLVAVVGGYFCKTAQEGKKYSYDRIEAEEHREEANELNSMFLNAEIVVKDGVLVARKGNQTTVVIELKNGTTTGLKDFQYVYVKKGLKLVYKKKVILYLKEK